MLADPMAVVALVLSALGAGGVVWPAVGALGRLREERRRRRETRETPQEFYYVSCSAALRILSAGREYVHRREARLVSRHDKLSRVPWGSRPYGNVEVLEEQLISNHPSIRLSIVDASLPMDHVDGWNRRYIQLSHPLRRKEEIEFVHSQRLYVAGTPLKHVLRWSPLTRCDHVTLQVAFASDPPAQGRFTVHALTGEELEWSWLPLDVITGAFTKHVDDPVPGRYYQITW